jgi:hypothetical protein
MGERYPENCRVVRPCCGSGDSRRPAVRAVSDGHVFKDARTYDRNWPVLLAGRQSPIQLLCVRPVTAAPDLGLLRDLPCVVDLDAKVSHGTFKFGMTKQELNGPKVLRTLVYHRCFSSAHRMRAINRQRREQQTTTASSYASRLLRPYSSSIAAITTP